MDKQSWWNIRWDFFCAACERGMAWVLRRLGRGVEAGPGRNPWKPRRVQLAVEGLERRELLSGTPFIFIGSVPWNGGAPAPALVLVGPDGGDLATTLEGVAPDVSYTGGTAPSDIGTYSVTVDFPGSADYDEYSVSSSYSVTQASPDLSIFDPHGTNVTGANATSPATYSYTGSPIPFTADAIDLTDGSPTTSLESASVSLIYETYPGHTLLGGAPTNIGTYVAIASFTGVTGTVDYANETVCAVFVIAKATPTVAVSDAGGTYNQGTFPATATVTGLSGTPGSCLESVGLTLTYKDGSGTTLGGAPSTAGTYTVQASFAGSTDYNSACSSVTFTINKKSLTVTGLSANNKVYDTTTTATLSTGGTSLSGVLSGDSVSLSSGGATGTFATKNAGSGITVTVSGLSLSGAQACDYALTPPVPTADITPAPLTIIAVTNTKTYDSLTSAAATPYAVGLLGSDSVTGEAEVYSDKNAGTSKVLSVSAYTICDGNSGGNYSVATETTTGVITKAPLTLTAGSNTKTWDGSTAAAATPAVGGLIGGDSVTGTVEVYANAYAGTGKTLSVSAYTINDGNSGNNYTVTLNTTTGTITPLVISYPLSASPGAGSGWSDDEVQIIGDEGELTASVVALAGDCQCGNNAVGLVYNQEPPIIESRIDSAQFAAGVTTIEQTLTWNGSGQSPVTFTVNGASGVYLIDDASTSAGIAGLNSWSMATAFALSSGSVPSVTTSGTDELTSNLSAAPAGDGWSAVDLGSPNGPSIIGPAPSSMESSSASNAAPPPLSKPITQLVPVSNGVIADFSGGATETFTALSNGNFTSPPSDHGKLTQNTTDYSYTYTGVHGDTQSFDSSGKLTATSSPNGVSTGYVYSGGLLVNINEPDGSVITFTYASGFIQTISGPQGVATLSYSGSQLTEVDRPDGTSAVIDYTGNDLTEIIDNGKETDVTYDAHNIPQDVDDPYTVNPAARARLNTSSVATTTSPATVVSPTGGITSYVYDSGGRPLTITNPDGGVQTFQYDSAGDLTQYTDALNRMTTYTYDAYGDVTSVETPDGGFTTYTYEATYHQVSTMTDPLGRITTYAYDSGGDVTTVTNPLGKVTTSTYYSGADAGLLSTTIDPLGHTTQYLYDSHRHLTATVDLAGLTTHYGYSATNQTTVTDAHGQVTTTLYDAGDHVTQVTEPTGQQTTYQYNSSGLLLSETDPNGQVTSYAYDSEGDLTKTIAAYGTGLDRTTLYQYDAAREQTAVTDALGHTTTTLYDTMGRVTAVIVPAGGGNQTTTYKYDLAGEQTAVTDGAGHTTTTLYDVDGRPTTVIDALGKRTTTVYDKAGQVTNTIDALGHTTTFLYDAAGEQTGVIDALSKRTTTLYDAGGEVTATIDALGRTTTFVYDSAERQIATVDPLGNRTTTVYDAAGDVTNIIDALTRTTTFLYDAAGHQTGVIDALGNRTTTLYDAAGDVTTSIDALNRTTTFAYDSHYQLTATVDAAGRTTTLYDAAGEVTASVDRLNHTTTFVYDAAGTQTAVEDALGRFTTTSYDAAGQVTKVVDGLLRTTQYQYDLAGNETVVIDPTSARTTMAYDADNRVTLVTDANGHTTSTAYDYDGNVTLVTDAAAHTTAYAYDADGRPTQVTDGDSRATSTAYDAAGEVTAVTNGLGTTSFLYDLAGRQTTVIDYNSGRTTIAYDADGETTMVTRPDSLSQSYRYDAGGQVTGQTDYFGNLTTTVYDADGEVSVTIDGLGQRTTMLYDGAGRVTTTIDALTHRTTSVYDADSRQTTLVDADGNSTIFIYDAVGNVTQQTEPNGHAPPSPMTRPTS